VKNIKLIDFTKCFLYRTLENYFNLKLWKADESIEATIANKKESVFYELKSGQQYC